ncbi:MAG: nucleotidyltransferase domain-containing protein [Lysobacterales bacterium]
MDLQALTSQHRERILFECVSGSRAYGTANADSDTDIRGIYAQPGSEFVALTPPSAQVSDERHNTVYYSLRRTLELLGAANPNILELLYMPEDCVLIDTPEMQLLRENRALFITRQYADTHVGYAFSQIKKAKGQNKWINQPKSETPPRKEDYCHVLTREALAGRTDTPCRPTPLSGSGIDLQHCHAARLEHAQGVYRLYQVSAAGRGVFRGDSIALESISLEEEASSFLGLLLYNEHAWRQAMDDHRNYWTWRAERNEARWRQQESGELDYDAKNLMHTIRLLLSGESILQCGQPIIRFEGEQQSLLLDVRAGRLSYTEVMQLAQDIKSRCVALRDHAALPEAANAASVDALLRELTHNWEQRCL